MSVLSRETVSTLQKFVDGTLDTATLSGWLVQREYDDELPEGERSVLARVRLAVIDSVEATNDVAILRGEVAAILSETAPKVRHTA